MSGESASSTYTNAAVIDFEPYVKYDYHADAFIVGSILYLSSGKNEFIQDHLFGIFEDKEDFKETMQELIDKKWIKIRGVPAND